MKELPMRATSHIRAIFLFKHGDCPVVATEKIVRRCSSAFRHASDDYGRVAELNGRLRRICGRAEVLPIIFTMHFIACGGADDPTERRHPSDVAGGQGPTDPGYKAIFYDYWKRPRL